MKYTTLYLREIVDEELITLTDARHVHDFLVNLNKNTDDWIIKVRPIRGRSGGRSGGRYKIIDNRVAFLAAKILMHETISVLILKGAL